MDAGLGGAGRRRLIELDFLRGVAVLLVLVHHSPASNEKLGWVEPLVTPVIRFGWAGVDLFFILSGFLVGGLLFAEIARSGSIDVRRFLIRRAFKIWPAYAVFIAYYLLKLLHRGASIPDTFHALWPNFVHLQNYFEVQNEWALAPEHTWSLAVEEHFYLVLPLLLLFLLRGAFRKTLAAIPWIAGILLIGCLLLRIYTPHRPFDPYVQMFPTHLRIDSLFLGVWMSYLYRFEAPAWRRISAFKVPILLFGLALIAPMFWLHRWDYFVLTIGFTMLSLGFACLLFVAVPVPGDSSPPNRVWRNPLVGFIGWIGVYSYSIYLWHQDLALQPTLHWLRPIWSSVPEGGQFLVYLTMAVPMAAATGFIMARIVEFPMLRIRERFFGPTVVRSASKPVLAADCVIEHRPVEFSGEPGPS